MQKNCKAKACTRYLQQPLQRVLTTRPASFSKLPLRDENRRGSIRELDDRHQERERGQPSCAVAGKVNTGKKNKDAPEPSSSAFEGCKSHTQNVQARRPPPEVREHWKTQTPATARLNENEIPP